MCFSVRKTATTPAPSPPPHPTTTPSRKPPTTTTLPQNRVPHNSTISLFLFASQREKQQTGSRSRKRSCWHHHHQHHLNTAAMHLEWSWRRRMLPSLPPKLNNQPKRKWRREKEERGIQKKVSPCRCGLEDTGEREAAAAQWREACWGKLTPKKSHSTHRCILSSREYCCCGCGRKKCRCARHNGRKLNRCSREVTTIIFSFFVIFVFDFESKYHHKKAHHGEINFAFFSKIGPIFVIKPT